MRRLGNHRPLLAGVCAGLLVSAAQPATAGKPPLGHPDFRPSRERPFAWRGDGSGLFPGASPPLNWNLETGENVLWTADLLRSNDVLVVNDTRVIPAELTAATGGS